MVIGMRQVIYRCVWVVFCLLFVVGIPPLTLMVHAETPTPTPSTFDLQPSTTASPTPDPQKAINDQKNQLENKISEYQKKVDETRDQRNTLAGQLQYLDAQAYVAQLRIDDTEAKIVTVQKEAEILGVRIESLDTKLDRQLQSFIDTAREKYKRRSATLIDYVLNSDNITTLVGDIKYHEIAEERAHQLAIQTEATKQNFEEQKALREKKKEDLAQLQIVLGQQQENLVVQQDAKKVLISATRNRENEYQSIIAEAQRQIQALKSFRISTGTNVVGAGSLGTGEGGWYYSQRDERWAGMRMGNSGESVLDVGCFISSLAMVLKSYGHDIAPVYFASNPQYFLPGSAWAYSPANFNGSWPGGSTYHEIPNSEIDGYLDRGIPVITSVRGQSHYVVLKKKVDGEYIMNDPIYGPDLKLSAYYSLSGRAAVFER